MRMVDLIEKKRDGLALTDEEIRFVIDGFTNGSIPDYQMSAFAMAVFFKGMTDHETAVLTDAMMRSGDTIDIADPAEEFSVGKYVELADAAVQDILARGKVCVIAGGTGLYVDSLIAGRTFAPVPSTGKRAVLEARMRAEGGEALLRELQAVDPEAAARLHPADGKRIARG